MAAGIAIRVTVSRVPLCDERLADRCAVDGELAVRSALLAEVLAARCPSCEYVYEVAAGDEHEGFAAGTAWADIPADWCCPDCGVREKVDFVPVEPERSVA